MKTTLPLALAVGLLVGWPATAQDAKPAGPAEAAPAVKAGKPPLTKPEERFKDLFTKAYLAGRWASLKDGQLGEEKSGDKYHIVSVAKGNGETWIINTKMKYRDQEFVLPVPAQVKFVGDDILLVVDNLTMTYGGIYSARLLIHERTYSGSWQGGRGGGMLYGVITNEGP